MLVLYIISLGKAKSAMKYSAACKPNQQKKGKEGKGKKRNESRIDFE